MPTNLTNCLLWFRGRWQDAAAAINQLIIIGTLIQLRADIPKHTSFYL
jgi:hypothetical protein